MALITTIDKNKLYLHVKHELGYPLRPFELDDDMMESYLEMVVEDYSSIVNNWLIEQQWVALEGMDKNTSDFLQAFSLKSNHYMESFTYAYSRQLGLGTNAPAAYGWELKRDFITTVENTQHYIIPAGREVNEVLWETPPSIDLGMVDPMATNLWAAGVGGMNFMGRPAQLVSPVYSTLLSAQDRRMKQRLMQSILTYRITGMESGEKLLHLYPVPGDRHEIGGAYGKHFAGRKIWYWYYDTEGGNRDRCLEENSDIVKLPSDAPTSVLEWSKLNDVAKQQIRNFLIAKVKMVIGGIRGFYSGNISATEKALEMDYRHLLDEGIKLKEDTEKVLIDQLSKITQVQLTENRMKIAQNINIERGFMPPKHAFIAI